MEDIRVAAVTKPKSTPDQLDNFFRQLLANAAVPTPVPAPVPMMEKLLQCLVAETQIRQPAPVLASEPAGLETLLRSLLSGGGGGSPPGSVVRFDPRTPAGGGGCSTEGGGGGFATQISSKVRPQDPSGGGGVQH